MRIEELPDEKLHALNRLANRGMEAFAKVDQTFEAYLATNTYGSEVKRRQEAYQDALIEAHSLLSQWRELREAA